MDKYNTLLDKKDFDKFLSAMPDYFNEIALFLNKESLSFDENEVRLVCNQFLKLNKSGTFDLNAKKKLISYIGEAFIKKYGGGWFFTGLKKDSFAINEPVISKYKNEGLRYCPSETIAKIFEDDNEDYFNWSIRYMEDFQKKTDDVFASLFPKKKKK